MSMRDKPRLSERIRGREGTDLFNEIKKEFEDDKNVWFGDRPFGRIKREGFPFENDSVFGAKTDAGIKSHLEDLAKKHPEFANDLKCPPWGGSLNKTWDTAFTVPVSFEKPETSSKNCQNDQNQSTSKDETDRSEPSNSLKNNLRKTVDIAEQIQKDNKEQIDIPQRSSSAPPDTAPTDNQSTMSNQEPKRFTSKIEITPVNPYEKNPISQPDNMGSGNSSESSASGDSKNKNKNIPVHVQNANMGPKGANVEMGSKGNHITTDMGSPPKGRHRTLSAAREIPIVSDKSATRSPYDSPNAGRKQPQVRHIPIFVEGRNDPVVSKNEEEPVERQQFQQEQAPLKRKLDNTGKVPTEQPSNGQSQQKQPSPQEKEVPIEVASAPTHLPPPPCKPKDPMERIAEVKLEVENLAAEVEQLNCKSRKGKEYLYLDEMLTRNLIKLDTIEVEGNDALRNSRKQVIKQIQAAIAKLESKVPSFDGAPEKKVEESNASKNTSSAAMDEDNSETKESAQKTSG